MACSNSTEPNDSHNNDSDNWRIAKYHEILTDIRWAKEHMSRVVQWTVLLQAALIAVSKSISAISPWLYGALSIGVASTAIWWLIDLHRFGRNTRSRLDELLKTMTPQSQESKFDRNHSRYLMVDILVVVFSTFIAAYGIFSLSALGRSCMGGGPGG